MLPLVGNKEDPEEKIGCPFHWKFNVRMTIRKDTFRMTISRIHVFEKARHVVMYAQIKEILIMEEF